MPELQGIRRAAAGMSAEDDLITRLSIAQQVAQQVAQPPNLVTDLAGATHAPFIVSPQMQQRMADRVRLALPEHVRDRQDYRKRINGLPVDVLMILELLTMMAEKGNHVAAHLLVEERRKFGIEPDMISIGR